MCSLYANRVIDTTGSLSRCYLPMAQTATACRSAAMSRLMRRRSLTLDPPRRLWISDMLLARYSTHTQHCAHQASLVNHLNGVWGEKPTAEAVGGLAPLGPPARS